MGGLVVRLAPLTRKKTMSLKVYEMIGRDACKIRTVYCGVPINMEFKGGSFANKRNASLSTSNKFVQDAIESDPRFGTLIRLTHEDGQKVTAKPSATAQAKSPRVTRPSSKKTASVESVRNVNDAIDYFASKGEKVTGEDMIEALKEKYNVTFPNLK